MISILGSFGSGKGTFLRCINLLENPDKGIVTVLRVMRALAEEGRAMLVVTHEMSFARDVSSRVMFLHQGLVEAEGPPQELFSGSTSDRFRQLISKERG